MSDAPYDYKEIARKRRELENYPERKEAFEELFRLVEHNMKMAKRALGYTSWWIKWQGELMGSPIITTDPEMPTACVMADPNDGRINFYFNLYFAATLSGGDMAFIMAHESLHFMLDHLPKMKTYGIKYMELWNIVTDAWINERLLRMNWRKAASNDWKLDKMTKTGIRWTDIPQKIRDKYSIDKTGHKPTYSCVRIYFDMLEYFEEQGIDPNQFEEAVRNSRYGKYVKRRKRVEEGKRGSGEAGETIFQKTYVVPGDVVWVRTQAKYGIIKDLRRTRDQKGEADIDVDSTLSLDDWRRANRAVGITTQTSTKSYANTRKIIDAYTKLRQSAEEPGWDDLARLTGIKEIAELSGIDTAQEEYDAATIMTPEEIEAEELAKEQEMIAKQKGIAGRSKGDFEELIAQQKGIAQRAKKGVKIKR